MQIIKSFIIKISKQLNGNPALTLSAELHFKIFKNSGSELKFLNKMPNPGILKSRDLRWGRIQRIFLAQLFNLKKLIFPIIVKVVYMYCLGCLDVSSPDWQSLGMSSILNLSTIIKYKLFNFIVYQFTISSLNKHDVVKPIAGH